MFGLRLFKRQELPPEPQDPVMDLWRPKNGEPTILLRWLFTEWCNYRCPYCPQTHDRRADKGGGMTAHGFDNFPVERWIESFDRHFSHRRLSLVLTGGETMIDRKNMTTLLNHLSAQQYVDHIRIDTNAWWKASQFDDLNNEKIILMCTFHPSQTDEESFLERITEYVRRGYKIGMVNYVMSDANVALFEDRRKRFRELDIPLHPNPLWGSSASNYSDSDKAMMRAYIPDLDYEYRTGSTSPLGKSCRFPSLSYEMDLKGTVHPGCLPDKSGSFFDDRLPELPGETACGYSTCVCLDKYSFLNGVNRNITTNPLALYSEELKRIAHSGARTTAASAPIA